MSKLTVLIINDFRNIFRDQVLTILFVVPFIFIFLLRFGLPPLVNLVPELLDYRFLIISLFCLVTASFPAFIFSFIMLDEKDEGVFIMYKVIPLSSLKFFFYRVAFVICFSWFFSFLILFFSNSVTMKLWQMLSATFLFSLLPPAIVLSTVTFARNKIEGVTIMKFLNFLLFLPVAGFFVQPQWKFAFGIIPVFWSYQVMDTLNNTGLFLFYLSIGIVMHLALLSIIFREFAKKN